MKLFIIIFISILPSFSQHKEREKSILDCYSVDCSNEYITNNTQEIRAFFKLNSIELKNEIKRLDENFDACKFRYDDLIAVCDQEKKFLYQSLSDCEEKIVLLNPEFKSNYESEKQSNEVILRFQQSERILTDQIRDFEKKIEAINSQLNEKNQLIHFKNFQRFKKNFNGFDQQEVFVIKNEIDALKLQTSIYNNELTTLLLQKNKINQESEQTSKLVLTQMSTVNLLTIQIVDLNIRKNTLVLQLNELLEIKKSIVEQGQILAALRYDLFFGKDKERQELMASVFEAIKAYEKLSQLSDLGIESALRGGGLKSYLSTLHSVRELLALFNESLKSICQ